MFVSVILLWSADSMYKGHHTVLNETVATISRFDPKTRLDVTKRAEDVWPPMYDGRVPTSRTGVVRSRTTCRVSGKSNLHMLPVKDTLGTTRFDV